MAMSTDVPLFEGFVNTTMDALRLIEAARRGLIPRVTRRLNDFERRTMIKSGAVFIFSVEESGIKRWTEGLAWSQSRISGNFLLYREVADRSARTAHHFADLPGYVHAGHLPEPNLSYKQRGLIKKTITVKIDGSDYHLISYYTHEDLNAGLLRRVKDRPDLMAIDIPPELTRSTNFRYPPNLEEDHDVGTASSHRSDRDAIDNHSTHTQSAHAPSGIAGSIPPSPVGEDSSGMAHGHFSRHAGHPSGYYYQSPSRLGLDTELGSASPPSQHAVSPVLASAQHRTHPYARRNAGPTSPPTWHASVHAPYDSMTGPSTAAGMYPNATYSSTAGHLSSAYDERRGSWSSHAAIQSALQPDAHRSGPEGASNGSPAAPSSWSPTGSPIHGHSLASAPPVPFSTAANLPAGRGREHFRARSYPSMQWPYDEAGAMPHSSHSHQHPLPAYPIGRGEPPANLEHYPRYSGGDGAHSGR